MLSLHFNLSYNCFKAFGHWLLAGCF